MCTHLVNIEEWQESAGLVGRDRGRRNRNQR